MLCVSAAPARQFIDLCMIWCQTCTRNGAIVLYLYRSRLRRVLLPWSDLMGNMCVYLFMWSANEGARWCSCPRGPPGCSLGGDHEPQPDPPPTPAAPAGPRPPCDVSLGPTLLSRLERDHGFVGLMVMLVLWGFVLPQSRAAKLCLCPCCLTTV